MLTVSFRTFGCKLNQAETATIIQDFKERGYHVVSPEKPADVFVINTCTVTERSDAKCRRAIQKALRTNPNTTVLVVGCYSQVAPNEIDQIQGVDYVFGTKEKFNIFEYFPGPGKLLQRKYFITPTAQLKEAVSRTGDYSGHTRAFLKIQDGCNYRCSYCIIPFTRGASRSVPMEEVINQAEILAEKGYREIVLTGVHIGEYGKDIGKDSLLPALLQQLAELKGISRIRLSSLESEDITDELLESIEKSEKICRHFHIPLQSGSNKILSAMNRRYTVEMFGEKIEKITDRFKNIGLGTDIIVGFPGETESLFEETFRLVEKLPFTYLHVFPFSPRRGTKAYSMPDQVEPRIRMKRAKKLRILGVKKKEDFAQQWNGKVVKVLLEGRNYKGWMKGITSEYLRVEVPYEVSLENQLVDVKIEKSESSSVKGRIIAL